MNPPTYVNLPLPDKPHAQPRSSLPPHPASIIMADLNPPTSPIAPPLPLPLPSPTPIPTPITTSSLPPSIQPLPTNPILNTTHQEPPSLAPKRQRRPSVRLGDIGGDPSFENSNPRRPKTSWRFHKDPSVAIKNSKTRPLTNLLVQNNNNNHSFLDRFDFGQTSNKVISTKPIKRPRTNWTKDIEFRDGNNEFRELEPEGSESPVRQQEQSPVSPVNSTESSRGHHETNGVGNGNEDEFRSSSVKDWLAGLGLGRYAPVFEIHEVDEEVLGMLTMEDLKDMGVNAVGSRRKMYTAIEKLRKDFS